MCVQAFESRPLSPGFGLSSVMKTVSFRINFLGTVGLRASMWGSLAKWQKLLVGCHSCNSGKEELFV